MAEIKMWAWVHTDKELKKMPFISIDESKEIVAQEKRDRLYGDPYKGKNERTRKIVQ